jgi:hypothetical protein
LSARGTGRVPNKLVCLESYWNENLFRTFSVKGFFESMAPLTPLTFAHRFVDSEAGLAYYLRRPDGVMWRHKEAFDAPVYYLAFHGRPAAVSLVLGRVAGERVIEAFAGYGDSGYRNLAYFAACSVLRGTRGMAFAREFLRATGMQAVIGYTTRVDWMNSLVCDMLFLHRFYRDPAPWKNLRRIHASVLRDYPRARRLGYTLVTPP